MAMPKDEIQTEMNKAWRTYLDALEKSLDTLEKDIQLKKAMCPKRR